MCEIDGCDPAESVTIDGLCPLHYVASEYNVGEFERANAEVHQHRNPEKPPRRIGDDLEETHYKHEYLP